MQPFVLNIWYMVGWSEEVTTTLLSRRIIGKPILLSRDMDGNVHAMLDRCPHRFAPLSLGRRDGNTIVCGYHGLRFSNDGRCIENPWADRIPPGVTVPTFPVIERHDMVWCWFGDAERADESLIPDFSSTTAGAEGIRVNGHTSLKANYEYGTDNLLDLSHSEFVHTGTFGGDGALLSGSHSVQADGERLHSIWWMPNVRCPVGLDKVLQCEIVDRWLDIRWDAPANMYLQVGATPPGEPREVGSKFDQVHILTPADVGETHYFWASNSKDMQPPEVTDRLREMLRYAFDIEDKPMIEAAYQNVTGSFWEQRPVSLGVDEAGTRARRVIERLKQREATSP